MSNVSIPDVSLEVSAQYLIEAGLNPLPIKSLLTKEPALHEWRTYQSVKADKTVAASWFKSNGKRAPEAIAVVCGAVSGNLLVIDFDNKPDGRLVYDEWAHLVSAYLPGLLDALPHVQTQSGGAHVYLRTPEPVRSLKLAETVNGVPLVETKGEGGYVLCPPSAGYRMTHLKIRFTPTVTQHEVDVLLDCAKALDERRVVEPPPVESGLAGMPIEFKHDNPAQWMLDQLRDAGWTITESRGRFTHLRRPGKDHGTSATLFTDGPVPVFYCFSTNASPIPARKGLDAFGLYAHLQCKADFKVAARELRAKGLLPAIVRPVVDGGDETPAGDFDWRKHVKSAKALAAKVMPPIKWVVPGLIPEGVTVIAGAPKTGKSLLGWGIACDVANGAYALGNVKVEPRPVLYLSMEDGERVVNKRLNVIAAEGGVSDDLMYSEVWPRLNCGGVEAIKDYLQANPGTVVVIDTYEHLRPAGKQGFDAYRNDSAGLSPLTRMIHELAETCILIHHTTKSGSEDFVLAVSGSYGLSGSVDTIMVLRRTRLERECKLQLTSRLIGEDAEYMLSFDPVRMRHTLLGKSEDVGASHLERAILECLGAAHEPLTPKQIARSVGNDSVHTIQVTLARLRDRGAVVQPDYGKWALPSVSNTPSSQQTQQTQSTNPGADCQHGASAPSVDSVDSVDSATQLETPEGCAFKQHSPHYAACLKCSYTPGGGPIALPCLGGQTVGAENDARTGAGATE